MGHLVDILGRRVGGAIVLAGALVAIGLFSSGGGDEGPDYQMIAADGELFRLNTESGTIIACNGTRCSIILERGQNLDEDKADPLFRLPAGPAAQPAPQQPAAQLPAPRQQPAQAIPQQTAPPKQPVQQQPVPQQPQPN